MIQVNNHNIADIEIDGHIITTIDIIVNGQSRRVFNKIAPSHTLEIVGPSQQIEGETVQLGALYDGMALPIGADPIWELRNLGPGFEDTIDNYGLITIDPNNPDAHPLEVFCTYNGLEASFNVTVLYVAGSSTTTTTETTTDPNTGESSTSTTTVINNQDGSSTSTTETTITDSGGNVVGTSQSETNTASDGSSSTTTTNYDANGDPTSGSNNTVDTQGNSNTQTLEYNNGVPYVNGYTIDTSNNPGGGETLNNSNIDTGMIVFDGKGFEMNLVFKCKCTENAGRAIFAAMENASGKKYSGFNFTIYRAPSTSDWYVYAGTNSTLNTSTGVFGSQVNGSYPFRISETNSKKVTQYTMLFRYLPANYGGNTSNYGQIYIELSPITTGQYYATSPYTKVSTVIPALLNNATFTLGGNGFTTQQNMINFEVISFNVQKI